MSNLHPYTEVKRVIIVVNGLPVRMKHDPEQGRAYGHSWHFEMDEDSIFWQTRDGILSGSTAQQVVYVGGLGSEVELYEQDAVAADLIARFNCAPVFLDAQLKEKFYKGFCKQFMWLLMHYVLPMNPTSTSRYNKVGRCKLDPGLKAPPGFKGST